MGVRREVRGGHPEPGHEVVWGIWQPPSLTGAPRSFSFLGNVFVLPLASPGKGKKGASLGSDWELEYSLAFAPLCKVNGNR